MITRPPEEIGLDDVGAALRRQRRADLDSLHAIIEENRDHLRPFMVWADQSRDDTAAFLAAIEEGWDADREYGYSIIDAGDGSILGAGGLRRTRRPDVFEIGYWRRADAGGRGLVTALTRELTTVGLAFDGIHHVEIHCDVANTASAAVPRRLGYTMTGIIDTPVRAPAETGRQMVWVSPPDWFRPDS